MFLSFSYIYIQRCIWKLIRFSFPEKNRHPLTNIVLKSLSPLFVSSQKICLPYSFSFQFKLTKNLVEQRRSKIGQFNTLFNAVFIKKVLTHHKKNEFQTTLSLCPTKLWTHETQFSVVYINFCRWKFSEITYALCTALWNKY